MQDSLLNNQLQLSSGNDPLTAEGPRTDTRLSSPDQGKGRATLVNPSCLGLYLIAMAIYLIAAAVALMSLVPLKGRYGTWLGSPGLNTQPQPYQPFQL